AQDEGHDEDGMRQDQAHHGSGKVDLSEEPQEGNPEDDAGNHEGREESCDQKPPSREPIARDSKRGGNPKQQCEAGRGYSDPQTDPEAAYELLVLDDRVEPSQRPFSGRNLQIAQGSKGNPDDDGNGRHHVEDEECMKKQGKGSIPAHWKTCA